jgi:uncharacterized small protein (DUF1192 family)
VDWDDVSKPKSQGVIGEPLAGFSVALLEERVGALKAEIARVETEIAARRRQADAANALFKPKT